MWAFIVFVVLAVVTPGAAELRVFVTNEKSNDVTVIDAASGAVLATIPVGQRPGQAGFAAYLVKPADPSEMVREIARLAREGRVDSGDPA